MSFSRALLCALVAASVSAGCASRHPRHDELGAQENGVPQHPLADYSAPLDLREFDVAETEGGYRGVFLKLSRLPTSVVSSSQSDPPRIIVDIQGPTGAETDEEVFPDGDTMVTHIAVSRHVGRLRVILEMQGNESPEFGVYPMADWVVVRIKPTEIQRRPWAHRAS